MATIIAWTNVTWNPTTGCSRVSEGCRHCYAERLSLQKGWSKKPWIAANSAENVLLHPDRLRNPYRFKTGTMCFVNSMSDLFHPEIPDSFLAQVFAVMNACAHVTFQILTKRPERAATWPGPWTPNIWQGTSIENRKVLHRLDDLRACPAHIRFISFEPLLEALGPMNLDGYHWAIVGGESGPGYRPMDHTWAREIRDQCIGHNPPIAFFFKQSAAYFTERGTVLLDQDGSATQWQQYPGQLTAPKPIA